MLALLPLFGEELWRLRRRGVVAVGEGRSDGGREGEGRCRDGRDISSEGRGVRLDGKKREGVGKKREKKETISLTRRSYGKASFGYHAATRKRPSPPPLPSCRRRRRPPTNGDGGVPPFLLFLAFFSWPLHLPPMPISDRVCKISMIL
jgi:hypothetical protein